MTKSTKSFIPQSDLTPDELAIISPERSLSWAELESRIRRIANGLAAMGIERGEMVAVLSRNRSEYLEMLLGNLRAGVRHVPVNWHLTAGEIAYILQDSGARLLVVDPTNAEVGAEAAREARVERVMVFGDEFEAWVADQDDTEPSNEFGGSPLSYTSGTTGRQKGVVRAGGDPAVADVIKNYRGIGTVWGVPDGGRHLVVCPLYHSAPPGMALMALGHGQSIVIEPGFDAERFLAVVEEQQVTTTHVVPTQIIRLLRLPDEVKQQYDTSSLVGMWHGAAPIPEWAKREAIEWLGPVLMEYFGSTEGTGPLIATSEEWLAHPGTVGRSRNSLEVSVVGDDGSTLPAGEVGVLYFKKPEGPPEYYGAPEKTAESRLSDGRFTVGDVGWMDEDGFVYLADRKIDMIIAGGVNIYPSETEAVLLSHPAVVDCAVFGIPDEEWGEQVKAAVQLAPGAQVAEDELIEFCKGQLATYKCPRSVDFQDELPREASGKLKKRVLRDKYWPSTT